MADSFSAFLTISKFSNFHFRHLRTLIFRNVLHVHFKDCKALIFKYRSIMMENNVSRLLDISQFLFPKLSQILLDTVSHPVKIDTAFLVMEKSGKFVPFKSWQPCLYFIKRLENNQGLFTTYQLAINIFINIWRFPLILHINKK